MKKILKIITIFILSIFTISNFGLVNAGVFDSEDEQKIQYCEQGGDCGLEKGVELVEESVTGIATEGKATDHIQKIVIYLLGFITFIAVIYIVYAGFRIMISSGEDEVIKNQKKTIGYVIVGILVIWFAWAIANFAVTIGTGGEITNQVGGS